MTLSEETLAQVEGPIDRATRGAQETIGDLTGDVQLREDSTPDQARGGLLGGIGEVKNRVVGAVAELTGGAAAGDGEALDPTTAAELREMEAAQDALQHQLLAGEITQDAYHEAWTSLIEKAPAAVLKASMQQASDDARS